MGFQHERPKKVRAVVKCPTCPTGDVQEGIYIFIMSIMRDSGDAVTMTPRCDGRTQPPPEGSSKELHSKGKEETDRRMKRDPNELYTICLRLRIWFSGGHCRYLGARTARRLGKETTTQLSFGGRFRPIDIHSPRMVPHNNEGLTDLIAPDNFQKKRDALGGLRAGAAATVTWPSDKQGSLTTYGGATIAEQGRAPWLF